MKPLKWYKNLQNKKERLAAQAFPLEGEKAICQVIASQPQEIIEIISCKKNLPLNFQNFPLREITEEQFASISPHKTPSGVMAVIKLPAYIYTASLPETLGEKILLLEDIQDPGNVGTLIRTAVAFNFSGVILSEKCADPFSSKTIQSCSGASLSLWIRRTPDYLELVTQLKNNNYPLISTSLNGTANPSILATQNRLLLSLGNEAAGLSPELLNLSDFKLKLPIAENKVESLNVAICGAICMYLTYKNVIL